MSPVTTQPEHLGTLNSLHHIYSKQPNTRHIKNTDRVNPVGKGPSTLLLPWLQELNGGGGDDGFTGNRLRSDRMMNPPLLLFHTGSTTSCRIPFINIYSMLIARRRMLLKSLTNPEKYQQLGDNYLENWEAGGSFNSD